MFLEELLKTIKERVKKQPEGSYVASLYKEGLDSIAQKVGEEGVEVVIASKNKNRKRQISEISDLFFHTLVLMTTLGISLKDIDNELEKRMGKRNKKIKNK